jgi:hypothetical protein
MVCGQISCARAGRCMAAPDRVELPDARGAPSYRLSGNSSEEARKPEGAETDDWSKSAFLRRKRKQFKPRFQDPCGYFRPHRLCGYRCDAGRRSEE